jgi:phospholipase C
MVPKPLLILTLIGLVATGCSPSGGAANGTAGNSRSALPETNPATGNPVSKYISHVVVIIQENRSFENFFAGYPGANAPTFGCVEAHDNGARSIPRLARQSSSGCPSGDTQVPLEPITFESHIDLKHDWYSSIADWDHGNMDGFYQFGEKNGQYEAYSYVKQSQLVPYWDMAEQYVLADAMFPTEFGGSFTGHLTLVAGTDDLKPPNQAEVDFPNGEYDDCDSPKGTISSYITPNKQSPYLPGVRHPWAGPYPCFTQWSTMAEDLDANNVSWKYYATKLLHAGMWEPFEAMQYVRKGPDWDKDIIAPQTKILTDPGSGNLASVSWVSPSKPDSDHPGERSDLGPSWVASVVNAVGESSYWPHTAIIVVWDDWGGWYDNAAPKILDYRGLGIRVPCLIISPYARETSSSQPGYISHTQYEYGSILKFIEEAFNLPPIGSTSAGYTDTRANSIDDAFDFTQQPRTFTAIPFKYPRSRFLHEPPSNVPVDTQ